ncbi:MAG: hypothetical protein CMK59_00150 [Proteobacteria bacterium]|nr:hypothetical protein [Pseudomonadota bacterium]
MNHIWKNNRPKVFWYASAGDDCRPLVFMHPEYQKQTLNLSPPELFIFSCLPPQKTYGQDRIKDNLLYRDQHTEITCLKTEKMFINRNHVEYRINRDWSRFGRDPRGKTHDAVLALVEIKSNRCSPHNSLVLYLHMENNNCFDSILSSGVFDLKYICATREGLALGGCGKSIMKHLYQDGEIVKAQKNNCDPKTVVLSRGQAHRIFQSHINEHYVKATCLGNYIPEHLGERDHFVYQMESFPQNTNT